MYARVINLNQQGILRDKILALMYISSFTLSVFFLLTLGQHLYVISFPGMSWSIVIFILTLFINLAQPLYSFFILSLHQENPIYRLILFPKFFIIFSYLTFFWEIPYIWKYEYLFWILSSLGTLLIEIFLTTTCLILLIRLQVEEDII